MDDVSSAHTFIHTQNSRGIRHREETQSLKQLPKTNREYLVPRLNHHRNLLGWRWYGGVRLRLPAYTLPGLGGTYRPWLSI